MQLLEQSDGWLVRVVAGEEMMAAVGTLMRRESIGSGSVQGLGAVRDPRLGYYDIEEKRYRERSFEGCWELAALVGSLSWYEGEPFPHVHVVLAGPDFRTIGGHCFEATVSATLELRVRASHTRIRRLQDEEIGLHLMELPDSCAIGPD